MAHRRSSPCVTGTGSSVSPFAGSVNIGLLASAFLKRRRVDQAALPRSLSTGNVHDADEHDRISGIASTQDSLDSGDTPVISMGNISRCQRKHCCADDRRGACRRRSHTLAVPSPRPARHSCARTDYRRSTRRTAPAGRGIYEIPGRSWVATTPRRARAWISDRDWVVTLDISADEYLRRRAGQTRALVRYP